MDTLLMHDDDLGYSPEQEGAEASAMKPFTDFNALDYEYSGKVFERRFEGYEQPIHQALDEREIEAMKYLLVNPKHRETMYKQDDDGLTIINTLVLYCIYNQTIDPFRLMMRYWDSTDNRIDVVAEMMHSLNNYLEYKFNRFVDNGYDVVEAGEKLVELTSTDAHQKIINSMAVIIVQSGMDTNFPFVAGASGEYGEEVSRRYSTMFRYLRAHYSEAKNRVFH